MITVTQVRNAYKETGLQHICCDYCQRGYEEEKPYCCPLTALYLQKFPSVLAKYLRRSINDNVLSDKVSSWAGKTFGEDYKVGFISGVDGEFNVDHESSEWKNGYKAGKNVRQKLKL